MFHKLTLIRQQLDNFIKFLQIEHTANYPKYNKRVWQYSSEEEEVDLQTALTGFQTKQRKILEPVDHGKIQYEPYRKNFYVEVPELARMTPEGQ